MWVKPYLAVMRSGVRRRLRLLQMLLLASTNSLATYPAAFVIGGYTCSVIWACILLGMGLKSKVALNRGICVLYRQQKRCNRHLYTLHWHYKYVSNCLRNVSRCVQCTCTCIQVHVYMCVSPLHKDGPLLMGARSSPVGCPSVDSHAYMCACTQYLATYKSRPNPIVLTQFLA